MPFVRLTLLMIILTALLSCTKQPVDTNPKDLSGQWQWVQSDGGLAAHIHDTPASTGKNLTLLLTPGGEYYYYTNGNITAQGTYTLETRACIHDQQSKTLVNFSDCMDLMVESYDGTTLTLSDEVYDGVTSVYQKTGSPVK